MQRLLAREHWEVGVDRLLDELNPWLERRWHTRLLAGQGEPLYIPSGEGKSWHCIYFAHGYFNSALHELAHWCVAGQQRRQLADYGYWYRPDGRTAAQQAEFERVEVKPQALEWGFSLACGRRFRTSRDNLSGKATDSEPFRRAVQRQALAYLAGGLPPRASTAVELMCNRFGTTSPSARDFAASLPD